MLDKIEKLMADVAEMHARNAEEAEKLRIKYLGRKGIINDLMEEFRSVAPEKKREVGQKLNTLKQALTERINNLKDDAATAETSGPAIDLTRTPYPIPLSLSSQRTMPATRPKRCTCGSTAAQPSKDSGESRKSAF